MAINQALPTRTADSTLVATPTRADNYGGAIVNPLTGKEFGAVAEGSYFVGITATPGTGIIGHAAPTTFDETKPYLLLYNSSTTVSLYPQFLQLHSTVASVGGARVQFTVCVDNGNRYSSAGSSLTVNNTNGASSLASVATTAKVGAVVATAASVARRVMGNVVYRGTIDIIEDVYELNFGGGGGGSATGSRVATVGDYSRTLPPIAVGPGQSLLVHQWAGSQSTGPTFEVIFGWIER